MSRTGSANGRSGGEAEAGLRPIDLCRALLEALDASDGRRRRRKRNTSADAIGMEMKRSLLEAVLVEDPDPDAFEGWLLERCLDRDAGEGGWRAMALEIFGEWRMAAAAPSFRAWLEAGAPSDDKRSGRSERARLDGRAAGPSEGPTSLPVLLILVLIATAGLAACERGIEADVEDVPEIELEALSSEARQRSGQTAWVLDPLLQGADPATVYDPPVDLARPAGAAVWPPRTGTHGDRSVGAAPADTTGPPPGSGGARTTEADTTGAARSEIGGGRRSTNAASAASEPSAINVRGSRASASGRVPPG